MSAAIAKRSLPAATGSWRSMPASATTRARSARCSLRWPGNDCVFGSRFTQGAANLGTPWRRTVSRGGTLLTNLLLGTRLTDMTSGFELFTRDALEHVLARGIRSRGPFFQTEIKAHCRDLRDRRGADPLRRGEPPRRWTRDRRVAREPRAAVPGSGSRARCDAARLVVTSIATADARAASALAAAASDADLDFILIGDEASPARLRARRLRLLRPRTAAGARASQRPTPARPATTRARTSATCSRWSAARQTIVETDDDTEAYDSFWSQRERAEPVALVEAPGWINVYSLLLGRDDLAARAAARRARGRAAATPFPGRGRRVAARSSRVSSTAIPTSTPSTGSCSTFRSGSTPEPSVALGSGAWCPFNSQNTTLVAGGLRPDVPAGLLLVPDDRHLAELRRAADRLGERLGRPLPRGDGAAAAEPARPDARLSRRGARIPREPGDLRGAGGARPRARESRRSRATCAGRTSCWSPKGGSTRESFCCSTRGSPTSRRSGRRGEPVPT